MERQLVFYWKWPKFGRKCLLRPKIPFTAKNTSYGRNFGYGRISAFIELYLAVTAFRQKSSFGHTLQKDNVPYSGMQSIRQVMHQNKAVSSISLPWESPKQQKLQVRNSKFRSSLSFLIPGRNFPSQKFIECTAVPLPSSGISWHQANYAFSFHPLTLSTRARWSWTEMWYWEKLTKPKK